MATVTVQVDLRPALAALDGVSGPVLARKLGAVVREGALFAERQVAGRTPVRTGVLRASVHPTQVGPLAWKVASPVAYAPAVEDGSRPHIIRPRRGKYLVFVAGGRRVFARSVHHPGTKGRHMFAQSIPDIVAALPGIVDRHLGGR
jgi:hypothetical protein